METIDAREALSRVVMSAPSLTADLHRRIATLDADRARLQLELLGARMVIEARRERDAAEVTA